MTEWRTSAIPDLLHFHFDVLIEVDLLPFFFCYKYIKRASYIVNGRHSSLLSSSSTTISGLLWSKWRSVWILKSLSNFTWSFSITASGEWSISTKSKDFSEQLEKRYCVSSSFTGFEQISCSYVAHSSLPFSEQAIHEWNILPLSLIFEVICPKSLILFNS